MAGSSAGRMPSPWLSRRRRLTAFNVVGKASMNEHGKDMPEVSDWHWTS